MKKDKLQGIIYVVVSIVIMVVLLLQLERSYEIAQTTYNVWGYVIFKYIVFSIFGIILGVYNIIRLIKKEGRLRVNFYVIAFSLLTFIIGYGLLFNNNFIKHFLLTNNLIFLEDFTRIAFGYSLTLVMEK